MVSYFLAPALVQLRKECDKLFPERDRSSDGWIGDASHQARPSDHNPCWSCGGRSYGIVRALDVDISPDGRANRDLRRKILKATVGDHRVWYVISNQVIYSRTVNFEARRYTGSNGHFEHVHVSLNGANGISGDPGNFDTSRWFNVPKPLPRKTIDLSVLRNQMMFALGLERGEVKYTHATRFVQLALNKRYGAGLTADGIMGPATLNAWGQHERRRDGRGRPRVADEQSLTFLVKGTRLDWKP